MIHIRHSLLVFLALCFLLLCCSANEAPQPQAYVVYLGGGSSSSDRHSSMGYGTAEATEAHLQLLSTVIPSEEKERLALLHSYSHAFRGFSAKLTDGEAKLLSGNAGVVSVFRDQILPLHTTRSWDFLDAAESGLSWRRRHTRFSGDVIIGIVDTGIWPESPSFDDAGIGEIPARWKGVCMEGSDFNKSHCNKKLIGARYYDTRIDPIFPSSDSNATTGSSRNSVNGHGTHATATAAATTQSGSPRDSVGHGTHTASTAAGAAVGNASYYGLAAGTARGGSPSSRLAMYKACSVGGCAGSNILKAIDDAVRDGVDVISISVGMSSVFQSDFLSDPIAIGAFHATDRGVMVVCSGGNDGPEPFTVVNSAPWIMTVAASSIDRGYESDVILGNGDVTLIKGSAITFSNLTSSKSYPLVFGKDVAAEFTPVYEASNCYPGSLDPQKAAGKIVVCVNGDPTVSRRVKKLVAEGSGARGLVLIDQIETGAAFDSGAFPFSQVGAQAGDQILRYINSTRNPVGTILPSKDIDGIRPAPVVAYFSSRGPGGLTESILKPDIMAPGVGILAAWIPVADAASQVPPGKKPSNYVIKSGTSMASPHVAGAAALLKSVHPRWTPSMIKSALMTTATASNNMGKPVTCSTGSDANHHDTGAGEINPLKALDPGLVYETTAADYSNFLCYYGYKQQVIRSVAGTNFTCPPNSTADRIATAVNYPSISIPKLDARRGPVKVGRTATNVGAPNSTYSVTVHAPPGLVVGVSPQKLVFSRASSRAYFEVTFESKGATKGYRFGAIVWSDGRHSVRTVFAVNVVVG